MNEFQKTIKNYLDQRAGSDELFARKYNESKKTIESCCNFIIGEAKKMAGSNAAVQISDDIVFGWAVHYYDEDSLIVEAAPVPDDAVVISPAKTTKKRRKKSLEIDDSKSPFKQLSLFD